MTYVALRYNWYIDYNDYIYYKLAHESCARYNDSQVKKTWVGPVI